MRENAFQSMLIKEIRDRLPEAIVLKMDPTYRQGIPDLLVLWQDRWAALECKREDTFTVQPNQNYYVKLMNDMSFARFINPRNKEEVLDDMERSFKA